MITKNFLTFILIFLQNIFLFSPVYSTEKYIEVDSIIAIAETSTVTQLELDQKKEWIKKTFLQQGTAVPSEKKVTKLALDQLITEKLVIEFAGNQGINVSSEQLDNVISNIAKSNDISKEELVENLESDGSNFEDFREDIRKQLIFDQVKRRVISVNLKISEFEIDNFIALEKERTPTKYNYSHIFIEFIKDNGVVDDNKTLKKLTSIVEKLKKIDFDEVAINHSDGPMASEGGLIGSRVLEDIPDIFSEPLISLKAGEISEPIYGSSGYHLLKLNNIKEFEMQTVVVKQSKVKQILLKKNQIISEDEIRKKLGHIRNLIIEGLSFSEAAKKYSEDGSAVNDGDLGWLNPGDTIPEFEKIMDNLELNITSQPVKTPLGWHLIQVTDRREKDLSKESLRKRVKEILLKQKTEIKFNDWVKTLKEGAHLEIWLYDN
jgi:peptidyl-prolyl cis-trans isomerase SurA